MKDDRAINLIRLELQKIAKPIISAMVAIGGGLVPFALYTGQWVTSIYVGIFLVLVALIALLIFLVWKLANLAKYSSWHDREYLLLSNKWSYSLSEDGDSLDAECIAEREMICHNPMQFMAFSISKDEAFLPFEKSRNYSAELIQCPRQEGNCTILPPHKKEGSSFAFRVRFSPPLRVGEKLHLIVKYKIPEFKISNIEDLRERMKNATIDARDYEINSFPISYPTKRYRYEVFFDATCKVSLCESEVTRGIERFFEEERYINEHNLFKTQAERGELRAVIERSYPPMKSRYKIKWKPPHQTELERA